MEKDFLDFFAVLTHHKFGQNCRIGQKVDFVFPILVVGTLNLCLLMLVNAKQELILQVIADLRKRPKTVQMEAFQTLG